MKFTITLIICLALTLSRPAPAPQFKTKHMMGCVVVFGLVFAVTAPIVNRALDSRAVGTADSTAFLESQKLNFDDPVVKKRVADLADRLVLQAERGAEANRDWAKIFWNNPAEVRNEISLKVPAYGTMSVADFDDPLAIMTALDRALVTPTVPANAARLRKILPKDWNDPRVFAGLLSDGQDTLSRALVVAIEDDAKNPALQYFPGKSRAPAVINRAFTPTVESMEEMLLSQWADAKTPYEKLARPFELAISGRFARELLADTRAGEFNNTLLELGTEPPHYTPDVAALGPKAFQNSSLRQSIALFDGLYPAGENETIDERFAHFRTWLADPRTKTLGHDIAKFVRPGSSPIDWRSPDTLASVERVLRAGEALGSRRERQGVLGDWMKNSKTILKFNEEFERWMGLPSSYSEETAEPSAVLPALARAYVRSRGAGIDFTSFGESRLPGQISEPSPERDRAITMELLRDAFAMLPAEQKIRKLEAIAKIGVVESKSGYPFSATDLFSLHGLIADTFPSPAKIRGSEGAQMLNRMLDDGSFERAERARGFSTPELLRGLDVGSPEYRKVAENAILVGLERGLGKKAGYVNLDVAEIEFPAIDPIVGATGARDYYIRPGDILASFRNAKTPLPPNLKRLHDEPLTAENLQRVFGTFAGRREIAQFLLDEQRARNEPIETFLPIQKNQR